MSRRRRYEPPEKWLYLSLRELGDELDLTLSEVKNLLRHRHPALERARRIRAKGSAKLTISRSGLEALKESRGHGRRTKPDPDGDWLAIYERHHS